MNQQVKNFILPFTLLLLMTVLPVLPLLQPGLPVTHDGQDHIVRIANFYASLTEGNIIPRWGSNLNWGFGHPVLMFLYPLPSYTASVFHWLGFSLIDSVKLVFAVTYILSGVTIFLWVQRRWGVWAGVVAGLLYTYAPYRFVDLSVRGAIGEHVAFVFLPLILLGIDTVAEKRRYSILLLALSIAGLLLSHNAVSIMMVPVALVYLGYLSLTNRSLSFFFRLLMSAGLGVSLSSFFLLPAFFEGKYTLRDIVTQGEVLTRFVPFFSFMYSPWNYGGGQEFTKQIGIVHWLLVGLSSLIFFHKKKNWLLLGLFWVLFWGSLWMMTEYSQIIWQSISLLQKFQFPWRLLTVSVLLSAVIGAIAITQLKQTHQQKLTIGIAIALLIGTATMWYPKMFKEYPQSFFTDVYRGTTDTGESSPIWSVRFMEFFPSEPLQIASGKAEIQSVLRTTTTREYKVTVTEPAMLVENTLYFPGWRITANGKEVPIEFQNPEWRGRMTFQLDPGVYSVLVSFQETRLRQVANLISLIGLGAMIVFIFI
jgi:hypothetical protein